MSKLTRSLAKSAVQFSAGVALLNFSSNLKQYQKEEAETNTIAQQSRSVKPDGEYKYVMREQAIRQINTVVSELMESVMLNGIRIEPNILAQAKEIIDMTEWVMYSSNEEKDNYGA